MNKTQTICDVCGAVKKETNHWWNVEVISADIVESCFGGKTIVTLAIRAYDREVARGDAKDACGEKCVTVLVSRFMATGSLEEVYEK